MVLSWHVMLLPGTSACQKGAAAIKQQLLDESACCNTLQKQSEEGRGAKCSGSAIRWLHPHSSAADPLATLSGKLDCSDQQSVDTLDGY